ncbi:hypothetical protein PV327_011354 [Microctonus hyperodae]|uniref:Uncharacterized protein n=1 Tax=Microctonus hyperodae TaxID=165561 RepID=A0AA39FL02_MICHY|nr:hypothetical protein PV327_011354 [Microctonus hyperodae]
MQLTNVCLNSTVWNKFFHDLQQLFSIAPKDKEGLSLYRRLNTPDLNEDSRITIELLLLPHLIPPKKKVKRNWKPSIAECKDSLLIHSKISGDLRHIFEKRQKSQNIETNAAGVLFSLKDRQNSHPVTTDNDGELSTLTDDVNQTNTDDEFLLSSQSSEITHSLNEST